MKPLGKVKLEWSPNFAYAIGLITSDGCLSSDGRHIILVSKDKEQIHNFLECLGIEAHIGLAKSGYDGNSAYRVQIGDVLFYEFLYSIGLMQDKSKRLSTLDIPHEFLFDFLRGHFDGDGTFYSYWDPRWRSSFMFYTVFISASLPHIEWIRENIHQQVGIKGHLTGHGKIGTCYQIKYAKKESLQLLPKLYYDRQVICLSRKREKIEKAMAEVGWVL